MYKEINKRLISKLPLPADVQIKTVRVFESRVDWKIRYCVFYLFGGEYLILKCNSHSFLNISKPCKLRRNSIWDFRKMLRTADIISTEELNKI